MNKCVLVTGAYGFIGRYVAAEYNENQYRVIGMGHGQWINDEYKKWGIDEWYECDITIDNLTKYISNIDIIVHCAGSGSVGFSVHNPMLDFERTVWTTHFVLEYIRIYSPDTKMIYPSSAAVYGLLGHLPLSESDDLRPISPYGYHKKIVEELCEMYAKQYGISIIIMRLFSVYGRGLKKQLLWDACKKLSEGKNIFWGTGDETRDWIHVVDVARYLYVAADKVDMKCDIVNVASGKNVKIAKVLEILFKTYGSAETPVFGGEINIGNPKDYLADVKKLQNWNLGNKINLIDGIKDYVRWYKENEKN